MCDVHSATVIRAAIVRLHKNQSRDGHGAVEVLQTTFAETPDVFLTLDPNTNYLVVLGTASVHAKVVEVLKMLDVVE